jgi:DNA primase
MIPIFDKKGRTIAFGGRGHKENPPKYLNSPDSELFKKNEILYGFPQAVKTIKEKKQAIVVEGYFDVIALHQHGFTNAIATLGTAFSQEHLKRLIKDGEIEVIFNFDSDEAGEKAIRKALKEADRYISSGELDFKVVALPEKDPDTFLENNPPASYHELLNNAPSWFDWEVATLSKGKDLTKPKDYNFVFGQMLQILKQISNPSVRANYLLFCSNFLAEGKNKSKELASVELPSIQLNLEKAVANASRQIQNNSLPKAEKGEETPIISDAEYFLILCYLDYPEYRASIETLLEEKEIFFTTSGLRLIWQEILKLEEENVSCLKSSLGWMILEDKGDRMLLSKILNPSKLDKEKISYKEEIALFIGSLINLLEYENHRRLLSRLQKDLKNVSPEKKRFYINEIQELRQKMITNTSKKYQN